MTGKLSLALLTVLAAAAITLPAMAGPLDRVEDRIDRAEGRIDRQTDDGRLDRIEDRIDAAEGRLDRAGVEGPRRVDRHERRTWRRIVNPPCVPAEGVVCPAG